VEDPIVYVGKADVVTTWIVLLVQHPFTELQVIKVYVPGDVM